MAWRDFWRRRSVLVPVLIPALVLGAVWWCAVLRLVLVPERAGVVEGAVAAGGWGLSLLPVHAVSAAAAGVDGGRRRGAPRARGVGGGAAARLARALGRGGVRALRRGAAGVRRRGGPGRGRGE
ncbi:hypothetical protein GCM10009730_48040 [Streptomyces albidochromogenes]|uniref:hypothetical protein n=1 Tax=Streptomyces albidochromogenes TaxID=329524 RepID=UPI002FE9AFED